MSKLFAIGDIHGCLDKLEELMPKIGIDPLHDTLIFIGDYIDRGGFSREVVDYVIRLQSQYKKVICLRGNHEDVFARYLEGVDEDVHLNIGGISTLHSYKISPADDIKKRNSKIPAKHRLFFESLLPYYETDDYIFVHAGLRPGLPLKEQAMHDMLWIRHEFMNSEKDFGKVVVFGHTPLFSPLIKKNMIGIDTGAVYGGNLTCVELPKINIYQA
ncbi:MAG: serine/threonine protein phosphatase [Deltaproteobacteria bacterium HGW-Deltaproteobacteria-13]|jgi:serine/threonine protein phosphatase 1|nr:MAG: serine/threonine protein phosphatase [Deltaproteobacteria bacterium HGW-Deltaproteobacteria-13]